MSHTPGRWRVAKSEPFIYALNRKGTNRFYALLKPGWLGRNSGDEPTPQGELFSDARLIAAAPELLEAANRALDFFEANMEALFGPGHEIGMAAGAELAIRSLRAAIVKADGTL